MEKVEGGCLCGGVRFQAAIEKKAVHACHCDNCQKWAGGPLVAIKVKGEDLKIDKEAEVHTFVSSDWAVREFCVRCGSTLWYRLTMEGEMNNEHYVALGTLDDRSGFSFESEMFIDRRPDCLVFAGDRKLTTSQQFFEMFGSAQE